jgi:hypothetical protein
MKKLIVVLFLVVISPVYYIMGQEFVDKVFSDCGLNFEAYTSRLSLRASNSDVQFPMDSMPVKFDIQFHQNERALIKAYLFVSVSGSNVEFSPVLIDSDSIQHSLTYFEIETGIDPCWGYSEKNLLTYDVTDYLTKNGNVYLEGFPLSASLSGTDTDGLFLLAIYSDPFESFVGNLSFSKGVIASNLSSASYVLQNLNVEQTSANAIGFLLAADLQDQGSKISLNNSSLFGVSNEDFWDFETKSTAVFAGQTTSSFEMNTPNDCAHLLMAGLYYQQPKVDQTPVLTQQGDTLISSEAITYEWFLGDSLLLSSDSIIVPVFPGDYSVIIEDVDGCKFETNTIQRTCFENYKPEIYQNGRTLKADSFYVSYQWYKNDLSMSLEQTDSVYATDSASYHLEVLDSLGCQYSSDAVSFMSPASISDVEKIEINIYPNPSFGDFSIDLKNNNLLVEVAIVDAAGKLVYQSADKQLSRLSLDLPQGIYFIEIVSINHSVYRKKLIIR